MAEARSRLRPESLSPDLDPLADEPTFPTPSDPSTCAEGDHRSEREAPCLLIEPACLTSL